MAFALFVLLSGCVFLLFVRVKSFRKKKKEFKTALITSFTLLPTSSYYKHEFVLITVFFNYHNLLYYNLFYYNIFYHNLFYRNIFESPYNLRHYLYVNKPTYEFHHLRHIFYCQNMTKIFCQFHKLLICVFYFEFFSFCV